MGKPQKPKAPKGGLTQTIGEIIDKVGDYKAKINRSKKSVLEGKARVKEAKAKVASAKQGYKKVQALAAGAAAATGNIAESIKSRRADATNAMNEALAKYNAIITNSAEPAEGTGSYKSGTNNATPGQGA